VTMRTAKTAAIVTVPRRRRGESGSEVGWLRVQRGEKCQRIEDVADPKAIGNGVTQDRESCGGRDAGIGIRAEEVVVVVEEVRADEEGVVAGPADCGEHGSG